MNTHPWARFRRSSNLTQQQVADALNIERLSVIRYEQGMFNHLSPELLQPLAALYNKPIGTMIHEYRAYQIAQREEFASTHNSWRAVLRGYNGLVHPLIHYRETYELSRNGLCKALCLDYSPISEYESNRQRAIPEVLKTASEDMHWDYTGLESAVLEWRSSGRSSK